MSIKSKKTKFKDSYRTSKVSLFSTTGMNRYSDMFLEKNKNLKPLKPPINLSENKISEDATKSYEKKITKQVNPNIQPKDIEKTCSKSIPISSKKVESKILNKKPNIRNCEDVPVFHKQSNNNDKYYNNPNIFNSSHNLVKMDSSISRSNYRIKLKQDIECLDQEINNWT